MLDKIKAAYAQSPSCFKNVKCTNTEPGLQVTSLLLSDAQNDTGSDWALKFLGQGTTQQPNIA